MTAAICLGSACSLDTDDSSGMKSIRFGLDCSSPEKSYLSRMYTVVVNGRSDVSSDVMYFASSLMEKDTKLFHVYAYHKNDDGKKSVTLCPPSGTTVINYKDHVISLICKFRDETIVSGHDGPEIYYDITLQSKVSIDVLKEFIIDAQAFANPRTDTKRVSCLHYGTGTHWSLYARKKKRSLNTIFLPKGELEKLVADLTKFLASEEEYSNYGVLYKRVYLLDGGMGLGKSSLVFTLASHFGFNLSVFAFGDKATDSSLMAAVHSMDRDSFLLLEDIDEGFRDDKISSNCITNILDGTLSKDRMVVFMTTNHKDKLSDALLRPGRIDMTIHFSLPKAETVIRILKFYTPSLTETQMKEISDSMSSLTTSNIVKILFETRESTNIYEEIKTTLANLPSRNSRAHERMIS